MITLVCASFILISLSVLAMAIGYLVQKKAIAGSCGGLATIRAATAKEGGSHTLICGNCGKDLSQSSSETPCADADTSGARAP